MHLYPFPTTLNMDAVKVVVNKLRGDATVTWSDANWATWELHGYASGQLRGEKDPHPMFNTGSNVLTSDEEMAAFLEKNLSPDDPARSAGMQAFKIPWAQILAIAYELFGKLLDEN